MPVNPLELLSPALLMAAFAAALVRSKGPSVRVAAAIGGAVLIFLPLGPTTPAAFFLGTFGPASAATLIFLAGYLYALTMNLPFRQPRALLVCLLVTGAAFYPLTFGFSNFDPYELGYQGLMAPALMLVFVLAGWFARSVAIPCWISLAALLYALGAYDSNNLWDYLISPVDAMYATGALVIAAWRNFRSTPAGQPESVASTAP
jgi:hypothetical protein